MKIKTKNQALKLVEGLSTKFKFKYLIIDSSVFKDDFVKHRTKHWTKNQFMKASEMLDDEICETSFYAVEDIIDRIEFLYYNKK